MKSATSRLTYLPQSSSQIVTRKGVRWLAAVTDETCDCQDFQFGAATLDPGHASTITPDTDITESDHEVVMMVTAGNPTVETPNTERILKQHDCVFVPPNAECRLSNDDKEAAEFLWGVATNKKPTLLEGDHPFDHGGSAQVVQTYHDLDPSVTLEPGSTLRHWACIFPETVGSRRLNLGLFQRPPGSAISMHGHDPDTITEAFTVLEGRLSISGPESGPYVLEPGDFLYVPEGGCHNNKNVGSGVVTYACLETPARSSKVSPVDE